MLTKIINFVKDKGGEIIALILISSFFFSLGYIYAKKQEKEPIKIVYEYSKSCCINS